MKRKRGHKKGHKSKVPKVASAKETSNEAAENIEHQNSEQNSGGVDESDINEHESRMEVDIPSPNGTDQPLNAANKNPDGSVDNVTGKSVGRVKVKLKTSKTLESEVPSQSDTDKSSPQMDLERPSLAPEKKDDSVNPLPERKPVLNVYRKTKGIKIKSSKGVPGSNIEKSTDAVYEQDQNSAPKESKKPDPNSLQKEPKMANQNYLQKDQKTSDQSSLQKEPKTPNQSSRYNKQELDDALTVIKKVMKMDAAEPFNVPVNPDALGIPDYFDIIDTPMDFGTICSNLENGDKYMNSVDVYKDIRCIWDNCCKYNKKGDYIIDLMKRVKKNFMKYWTAAGLFSEQATGVENTQGEDAAQSSQWKLSVKGGQSKQKSHKRHGRRHKNDCLCAVCVLKRRKREREENARISQGQIGVQEESSPVESPSVEYSSLNMGEDQDIDADVEGKVEEVKLETGQPASPMGDRNTGAEVEEEDEEEEEDEDEDEEEDKEDNEMKNEKEIEAVAKDKSQLGDRIDKEPSKQPVPVVAEKLDEVANSQNENLAWREEIARVQQQKQKELQRKQWKAKMHEKFGTENPMVLSLCGALFPENDKSVWSGPHSLLKRGGSANASSIHKAIETLMEL